MSDRICSCGATNLRDAQTCWHCKRELPAEEAIAGPALGRDGSFSLAGLMLMVTLIAVCLGISVNVPGLGIPLLVVSVPAMIRASGIARRRQALGRALTRAEQLEIFFVSIAIVTLIVLAGCVAFCATCFPIGLVSFGANSGGEVGLLLAFGIGIPVGLFVTYMVGRKLWPDHALKLQRAEATAKEQRVLDSLEEIAKPGVEPAAGPETEPREEHS